MQLWLTKQLDLEIEIAYLLKQQNSVPANLSWKWKWALQLPPIPFFFFFFFSFYDVVILAIIMFTYLISDFSF